MKICTKCLQEKPMTAYSKDSRNSDGFKCMCKECINEYKRSWERSNPEIKAKAKARCIEWNKKNRKKSRENSKKYRIENKKRNRNKELMKKYGIDLMDYDSLYSYQNGKCAICQKSCPSRGPDCLFVDHEHVGNMEVRGLLCRNCNTGIGMLKDDIQNLKNAIKYLENPPKKALPNI